MRILIITGFSLSLVDGKRDEAPLPEEVELPEGRDVHGEGLYAHAEGLHVREGYAVGVDGLGNVSRNKLDCVLREVENVPLRRQEVAPDPEEPKKDK